MRRRGIARSIFVRISHEAAALEFDSSYGWLVIPSSQLLDRSSMRGRCCARRTLDTVSCSCSGGGESLSGAARVISSRSESLCVGGGDGRRG
jgi:hypothetical protein